jgi:WD40 repeat protein
LAIPPNNGPLPGDGKIGVFSRNRFNNSWEGDVSVWLDQKGKSAFIHRNGSGLPAVAALRGWDLRKMSGRDLVPVPELESVIYAVALSPAARQLAISVKPLSQQGKPTIECWPIADKPTMRTIKTRFRASSLAYSPDGKILAAGFENGAVAWYESASGKVIKGISMPDDHMVGTLAFHPGGTYLACGLYAEGTWNLFLVDIPSGEIVNELLIEKSPLAVCFSPTGERLAVFGSSGKVTIWDATKLMKLNGK